MSEFTQRLQEHLSVATALCTRGGHETTVLVRADDFCAIHRILYRCFKEDQERQSGQAAQKERAVPGTVPVTIHVDGGEAIMRAPWWIIMDVPTFRKRIRLEMEGNEYASVDEISDDDLSACIVECFRGPFFSIAEAEAALPLCAHRCYYKKPEIECVSGGHNPAFDAACTAARKANNTVECPV